MWEQERLLAEVQCQPLVRFVTNQPNVIRNSLIREASVNTNSMSVSPPRRIILICQILLHHMFPKGID
jgi:hypothetical protein